MSLSRDRLFGDAATHRARYAARQSAHIVIANLGEDGERALSSAQSQQRHLSQQVTATDVIMVFKQAGHISSSGMSGLVQLLLVEAAGESGSLRVSGRGDIS